MKKVPKILFVIDSLRFGGAERQLVELIKGLQHRPYEVHLVSLDHFKGGYTDILLSLGMEIHYFSRTYKYDIRPILALTRYIKRHQINIVHTFMNYGSLAGMLAAKLSGIKVVCSAIRNAKDKNLTEKFSKKFLSLLSDIFVSNSLAGFRNRFTIIKSHFRVVYNGIDFRRFQDKKIDLLRCKTISKLEKFRDVVGMVASFSAHKDHDTLVLAAPSILEAHPETLFLCIGDGPNRKKTEEKVKTLGIQNNFLFLGDRKDVDQLYHLLDIVVLLTNSDVRLEGISNVILEAMATGIPVVASEGGGTNEIIKHNINGILVPPKNQKKTADAIKFLLSHQIESEKLAKAGQYFVRENFNLKRYIQAYEKIYKEIMPNKLLS